MQGNLQSSPLISVGIPFYNSEKYLADAIKSVLAQTCQNWELILVDDGSTDNSLEIAREFEKQDNRIRVMSDGKNKKLPARLNQIIAESKGEYIARMDGDDIMHPNRLQKQIDILQSDSTIDVLGTNAYVIDTDNLVTGLRYSRTEGVEKINAFIHPSIMGKKQWFIANPYDEKAQRMEDAELWYRSKDSSNFMITFEPLLFYREFGGDYYKKYWGANISKKYMLQKYHNDKYWRYYFLDRKMKGAIYWIANKFALEQKLIDKRSQVNYENKLAYKEYI